MCIDHGLEVANQWYEGGVKVQRNSDTYIAPQVKLTGCEILRDGRWLVPRRGIRNLGVTGGGVWCLMMYVKYKPKESA